VALIQIPDIGLRLKEFLGLTHLPDQVLAPETVATIVVGDLTEGAGGRSCVGTSAASAVAAQRSIVSLGDPVPDGPIRRKIVIKRVSINVGTTSVVSVAVTGAVWSPDNVGANKIFQDLDFRGFPRAIIANDNRISAQIPATFLLYQSRFLANTPYDLKFDLSLGSRTFQNTLLLITASDNLDLTASFEWTEF